MVVPYYSMVMPKEEVEQIARFKDLTDVQRSLLLSARKEPEKHEKAERAAIMHEHNCSELEAVHIIAEKIAKKRGG